MIPMYLLCDGEFDCGCPEIREKHGTLKMYRTGCRCRPCKDANTKSHREWRARREHNTTRGSVVLVGAA